MKEYFKITEKGCLKINKDRINELEEITELVIPEFINGIRVLSIPDDLFCLEPDEYYETLIPNITSVILPEGLKSIGDRVFRNCCRLQSINLPSSLEKIGEEAFQECNSLKGIIIPPQIKELSDFVFSGCDSLEIVLPDNIKKIGYSSLGFMSMKEFTIPKTVETISDYAFTDCELLETVHMNKNTKIISTNGSEQQEFKDCDAKIIRR